VKQLKKETLLTLLAMYDAAIRELESLNEPQAAGLVRRLEHRRAEVIDALGPRYWREDT
jgi:hypothetical protein